MDKEIRDAIARVRVQSVGEKERSTGTGFLVAPDLVATAFHVIGDRSTNPPAFFSGTITLMFPSGEVTAEVVEDAWNISHDCVLLKCMEAVPATPIPLRELRRSADKWETHGWSKMQWVDGMGVGGFVRNHATQLNKVPAIQLFSQELATYGASASGLSGGPVLIDGEAVGLLRSALGKKDLVVAGTTYGCPAPIIAALSAAISMTDVALVKTLLSAVQLPKIIQLYESDFSRHPNLLSTTIRYSLGMKPAKLVDLTEPFSTLVAQELTSIHNQGEGLMEVFLNATVSLSATSLARGEGSRLKVGSAVRNYCDQEKLNLSDRVATTSLVYKLSLALNSLIELAAKKSVVSAIAPYRAYVESIVEQLVVLDKYKTLHNCLHNLQYYLEKIGDLLRKQTIDAEAKANIPLQVVDLGRVVADARGSIDGLENQSLEQGWIDALSAYIADFAGLSNRDATLQERLKILEDLRRPLGQSSRINSWLAKSADNIKLTLLAEMMEAAFGKLDGDNPALPLLSEGSAAVGALRASIAGLVAEHSDWQVLNANLDVGFASGKFLPASRFPEWEKFKTEITMLCEFRADTWSILDGMNAWERSITSDSPSDDERNASNEKFGLFYRMAGYRFFDVDSALRIYCGKITPIAEPLKGLLTVMKAARRTKVPA
jgi:hypothetical protein